MNPRISDPPSISTVHSDRMENNYRVYDEAIESKVRPEYKSTLDHDKSTIMYGSSNDFLQQMESLDPSGLTTLVIETLQSIEISLQNSNGKIDIVTFECILTEFLQRNTDLINRYMENVQYRLEMEKRDDCY
jgi:RNase H-fold protein (predicted Holliday junction resolvase)